MAKEKFRKPPSNLPVYAPEADVLEENTPEDIVSRRAFQAKIGFALAFLTLFGFLFVVVAAQKEAVEHMYGAFIGELGGEYARWLFDVLWKRQL